MIAQTLKVETTRLEKGEVAIIDDIPHEIIGTEKLFYYVVYRLADLPVGTVDAAMNILNLQPEVNELYNIECIGIDGGGQVRIEYPSGAQRMTPHQVAEYLDQITNPKTGGCCGCSKWVYFWCVSPRYPTTRVTNPYAEAIDTVIYFYGWKYRTRVITAGEVETKRAMGIRVIEAESYYPTS